MEEIFNEVKVNEYKIGSLWRSFYSSIVAEAKEDATCPRTRRTHSVVISVLKDQRVIIINGDKQLLSTEVRESIEKYAAEEGITDSRGINPI